jgi:Tol biopolymer transport system component
VNAGEENFMIPRSELAIFDVSANAVTPVLQTERLIEAPNWTRDGAALIVNGNGRLYRVDLQGEAALREINSGFAVTNNNDHGLSPDGKWLAVSDHSELGKSCIYTLPAAGGTPRRVTVSVPSYWHGWSPDGARLAYCGERNGVFDIYTIAVEGGAETCLTSGLGHNDGPDYTTDGQWIWFNSTRGGTMQLWRMRPDGSAKQQMTDDERVNWFPHPSPDGRHIVYLAYENGTTGHPRDCHVELRLMPAAGGTPRTLLKLFGGQGTINVPSWAPDSQRFAFARYFPANP